MSPETILGILLLVIAALAVSEFVARRPHTPGLVYLVLPPYEVPDLLVAAGVVVENRGGAPAHQVRISLTYPGVTPQRFRHLQVLSDVEYVLASGGENESFVTLTVGTLNPDQKLIIYFTSSDLAPPRVTVTQGAKAGSDS